MWNGKLEDGDGTGAHVRGMRMWVGFGVVVWGVGGMC